MAHNFSNYGPIINDRQFHLYGTWGDSMLNVYPISDSVQTGPIISKKIKIAKSKENDQNPKLHFIPTKQLFQSFPLYMKYPCYLPLQSKFKENDHFDSNGNCLDHFKKQDSEYLIYVKDISNGKQQISFSEICLENTDGSSNNGLISLKNETEFIDLCKIDQITTSVINDNAFGLFRNDKNVFLANLENQEICSKEMPKLFLTDCCLHNRIGGYFAVAASNGRVHLFDSSRVSPLWTKYIGPFSKPNDLKCEFGNDALSLLIASDSNVWAVDTRLFNAKRNIFCIEPAKRLHDKIYNVSSFVNVPNSPYIYINSSSATFLCDDRNCKQPVMMWQNMMDHDPKFAKLNVVKDFNVLSLCGKNSTSHCVVTAKMKNVGHSESFVQGISTPKHFGILSKTKSYANSRDMWFSHDLRKHFQSKWKGMATTSFGNKYSFCNIIQNRLGAIFYQIFNLNKDNDDQNLIQIDSILEDFENCISKSEVPFSIKDGKIPLKLSKPLISTKPSKAKKHIQEKSCIIRTSPDDYSYWKVNEFVERWCNKMPKCSKVENYICDDSVLENLVTENDPLYAFPEVFHSKLSGEGIDKYKDPLTEKIIFDWNSKRTVNNELIPNEGNFQNAIFKRHSTIMRDPETCVKKLKKNKKVQAAESELEKTQIAIDTIFDDNELSVSKNEEELRNHRNPLDLTFVVNNGNSSSLNKKRKRRSGF